ncbi:GPW/gp25 family protein [Scytonema sp. NUACC26]|uniref:GPW/gp25 family protein n=1 Tax=Scytonema sp. NUACC26 TaxID=3140176 RepID=UPI0034DB8156
MPETVNGQQNKYLGRGWAFPLQLSVQGGIQLHAEAQKVRESIWLILRTEIGERVYRPDFGSRLSELAFAPMNNDTLLQIRLYVREALEKWEPRIMLDRVVTDADPVRGRVDILIAYRLKNYPDIYNFVYPFYLLTEEEE